MPRVLVATLVVALLGTTACGGGDGGDKNAVPAVPSRLVERAPGPATITVDFGVPTTTEHALTGLLLGLTEVTPPDSLVRPIKPQLVRAWPDVVPYARAVDLGAQYVELVSDEWGYPFQDWKGKNAPWVDFAKWEDFVGKLASTWRGRNVIFDIWNEPNSPLTWQGTFDQYIETFVRAARVIRSVYGDNARIAGPETNLYDPDYIGRFMDAMRSANVRVDVLTWHELPAPEEISQIQGHAQEARARWYDSPDYKSVGVQQLGVYETIRLDSAYAPGDALSTFYYMEKGKVDAAARACWPQENGLSSCTDGTMGKLLTPNDLQPRSVWWAYKLYADGVDSRVQSSTTDPLTVALASTFPNGGGQVIVARTDKADSTATVSVPIDLKGLIVPNLKVSVSLLPTSGAEPLATPPTAGESVAPVTDGLASIQVTIAAHEGLLISLSPA